jgi:glycosyltransferase involved in cell wall biosynthesis
MPKISAVMALYNTPYEYLKKTVESILNQTFEDFELIVIDDASSIDYMNFFKQFKDERIKYFKLEKNAGPGHARNQGIKKAIGEYVAIVDSDDIYMNNRFELQSEFLDKNPDISLISGGFKQSNNGKIPFVIENNEDIKTAMLFNSSFANPLVMFRKNVFIENGLFYPENINFGEDYELWINAMFKGVKMANLKNVLMIYTRRKNQLSKTKINEQLMILKNLYKKILSNLNINFSQVELDLHYKIYEQDFSNLNIEEVSIWMDKIISANKNALIFDEQKLIERKESVLSHYKIVKNRLFKIKIKNYNFCIDKKLNFYIEKRD